GPAGGGARAPVGAVVLSASDGRPCRGSLLHRPGVHRGSGRRRGDYPPQVVAAYGAVAVTGSPPVGVRVRSTSPADSWARRVVKAWEAPRPGASPSNTRVPNAVSARSEEHTSELQSR